MASIHFVSGASGTGKSTFARSLTPHMLVISTDVIRAMLRTTIPQEENPALWAESFNVPLGEGDVLSDGGANLAGFLRQCAPIIRAVNAAVAYAIAEQWDCIVEGVHLVPGLVTIPDPEHNDVQWTMLHVGDADVHRSMFTSREAASGGGRPATHYHNNLSRIHDVQAFLVEQWNKTEVDDRVARELRAV